MSILDKGMKAITTYVSDKVAEYPEVKRADDEAMNIISSIRDVVGDGVFLEIESAFSAACCAYESAAFRVGVTEGLKLANSVRTLIGLEADS